MKDLQIINARYFNTATSSATNLDISLGKRRGNPPKYGKLFWDSARKGTYVRPKQAINL